MLTQDDVGLFFLQDFQSKLKSVASVRRELKSHIQSLPDMSLLPTATGGLAPLPSLGDLFSIDKEWPFLGVTKAYFHLRRCYIFEFGSAYHLHVTSCILTHCCVEGLCVFQYANGRVQTIPRNLEQWSPEVCESIWRHSIIETKLELALWLYLSVWLSILQCLVLVLLCICTYHRDHLYTNGLM